MYLGGFLGELGNVAAATYGTSIGLVVSLFVACWVVLRWKIIKVWVEDRIAGREEFKLKTIFNEYTRQVASIKDRRQLYIEILKIVSRLARSENISLLLKNAATQKYVVRESLGPKPMSFHIGPVDKFIQWMAEARRSVTRAELVESPDLALVRTPGLQYCVQFHAEAAVPLVLGDDVIGVINIGCRTDGREFENRLFTVLDLMAGQFAVAIHNVNLYEGLLRQNVKLKQLDLLKTQLLANVSHELRTPLNSIIGLSDLMVEGAGGPVTEDQKNHLTMIRSSGSRLLETVTALLDLSKLEAGAVALDVKRVSLRKMAEDVAEPFKSCDHVSLAVDVDEGIPPVYGDAQWISCVFKNLLSNAVKYTPQGKVNIDCDRIGDRVRVGVHDTGIGIDKAHHEHIFSGFVQGNGGLEREHEGTGLGLTISKKIVELHGGRLWLESLPGRGSHFFFTLPLKPNLIPSVEIPDRLQYKKAS